MTSFAVFYTLKCSDVQPFIWVLWLWSGCWCDRWSGLSHWDITDCGKESSVAVVKHCYILWDIFSLYFPLRAVDRGVVWTEEDCIIKDMNKALFGGGKNQQKSSLQRIFLTKMSGTHNFHLKFFSWCAFRLCVRSGGHNCCPAKDSFIFMMLRFLQPHSYVIELLIIKVWTCRLKAEHMKWNECTWDSYLMQ